MVHPRVTLDSHVDIPWPSRNDFCADSNRAVDIPKLQRGGINAVCFAAYVPQGPRNSAGTQRAGERTLAMLEEIRTMAAMPGMTYATDVAEIRAASARGDIAVLAAVENGTALGDNPDVIEEFSALGVRYVTLTHNGHNALADAAIPRRDLGDSDIEHDGLSPLGLMMIKRMNDHGIIIDISHASKRTMMQAAKLSRAPVVATHSCVRALCDHPRNLDDEQLRAIRDVGGVIQITLVPGFLRPNAKAAEVSVNSVVDHIQYVIDIIGISHVGIGTDFDGGGGIAGCASAAELPALTAALRARGYPEDAIEQIWGGNFLRTLEAAESAAIHLNPCAGVSSRSV